LKKNSQRSLTGHAHSKVPRLYLNAANIRALPAGAVVARAIEKNDRPPGQPDLQRSHVPAAHNGAKNPAPRGH